MKSRSGVSDLHLNSEQTVFTAILLIAHFSCLLLVSGSSPSAAGRVQLDNFITTYVGNIIMTLG